MDLGEIVNHIVMQLVIETLAREDLKHAMSPILVVKCFHDTSMSRMWFSSHTRIDFRLMFLIWFIFYVENTYSP